MLLTMLDGPCSLSLKIDSTTLISVEVVSSPQNAVQSFATTPAPSTSDPRLTVPATNGIYAQPRILGVGSEGQSARLAKQFFVKSKTW